MNSFVIGIDQSYKRTGITILKNKQLLEMFSLDYFGCKNNTQKRTLLVDTLNKLMKSHNIHNPFVITERIRLTSQGVLSQSYIKSTGALVATIIDFFYHYDGTPVYSVDTRAWKTAVVGTSRPQENKYGIDPNKYPTILYLKRMGLLKYIAEPYKGKGKKGIVNVNINGVITPCKINDDLADSYCIAKYGTIPEIYQKLQEEKF